MSNEAEDWERPCPSWAAYMMITAEMLAGIEILANLLFCYLIWEVATTGGLHSAGQMAEGGRHVLHRGILPSST